MEWGTFTTVIFALYLVWYGFNFLIDLIGGASRQAQTEQNIQYNVSDFLVEEEPAQQVNINDYTEPVVNISPAAEATTPDVPNSGGAAQHEAMSISASIPTATITPVTVDHPITNPLDDWASVIDQEEESIEIPVQGTPIPVMDYIQSFKNQAKSQAAQVFS